MPPSEIDAGAGPLSGEDLAASRSPRMQEALGLAEAVASRDTTVLLVGETGTGKGVLARFIHRWSPRRNQPFVELNSAALQKELAESEIFGHERGAFTGALERKIGLLQASEGGSFLLDEIGDMDVGIQAKLLHCIEKKTFRRVGGVQEIPANVRLIAATHRDLGEQARQGRFREDLYHRLNVFTIRLPPLRERAEDIGPLAAHLLGQLCGPVPRRLHPTALAQLTRYPWPGNIRELRNVLERATILCPPGSDLLPCHLLDCLERAGSLERPALGTMRDAERLQIESTIRWCGGNVQAAARALGISRSTIYRKAKRYGIPL